MKKIPQTYKGKRTNFKRFCKRNYTYPADWLEEPTTSKSGRDIIYNYTYVGPVETVEPKPKIEPTPTEQDLQLLKDLNHCGYRLKKPIHTHTTVEKEALVRLILQNQ